MLRISVLGSGSGGNSAVVWTDETRLLIDAGLSARQITRRLESVGVPPDSLDGILITHEHGDHVRGLDVFCRSALAPVFCNRMTREVLAGILSEPKPWKVIPTGGAFRVGDIEVQPFSVAHDATEPLGFVFRDHESSIGVLSDVGYVTHLMRAQLKGVNLIFVEANYDELMLQNDIKRPWSTKQRILSRHGHLSNTQAASLLRDVAGDHLHCVVLGHLSQDCNDPELAVRVVSDCLAESGWPDVEVLCASQEEPTPVLPARRELVRVTALARESEPRAKLLDLVFPQPVRWEQAELF